VTAALPARIPELQAQLAAADYVADTELATVLFLSLRLRRPVFLEGEPGTGKTEVARTLAQVLQRPLIRLQCFEGLDMASAAYEWNYPRQMIEIRLAEPARGAGLAGAGAPARDAAAEREALGRSLFTEHFLIRRPLLQAIDPANAVPPVLLIDEIDRADAPFEAFLLELLADFQLTIPELGTIKANEPPIVVLTSNRTREIHDAVKRRCLYHWVGFPDAARELDIVRRRVPGAGPELARQIVAFIQGLRRLDLYKLPGIAETLEWSRALLELDAVELDPALIQHTLGVLLKYQDDIAAVQGAEALKLLEEARRVARE
jgi:MoxR-like ATPase